MATLYIIIIIFLIVCLFSIVFNILHLYVSKNSQKRLFDAIYEDMEILKEEIKKIKKNP